MIQLVDQLPSLRGHFSVEVGYHAPLCMDLEPFVESPELVESRVALLVERLRPYEPDAICGRPVAGANLASMVARALDVPFYPAFPVPQPSRRDPTRPEFKMSGTRPSSLAGARIAIVDGLISAGAEVRAVCECLLGFEAEVCAVGALLMLGRLGVDGFAALGVPLEALEQEPCDVWLARDCPLCRAHVPLVAAPDALRRARERPDMHQPRSVKSAVEKMIALLSAPSLDDAYWHWKGVADELHLNRASEPWVLAAVRLYADKRLTAYEMMYFLDLIKHNVGVKAADDDPEINRLTDTMWQIAEAHGFESCFESEAKAIPEVAEMFVRWYRRHDELTAVYWRSLGADDAADLLEQSSSAFEGAWKRGQEEFEGRWASGTLTVEF